MRISVATPDPVQELTEAGGSGRSEPQAGPTRWAWGCPPANSLL
jgi:hypothetical protein